MPVLLTHLAADPRGSAGRRMFDVYCLGHGSRVLLFTRDIENVRNTSEGIEVHFRCFCGYQGVWRTGRRFAENECVAHVPGAGSFDRAAEKIT